MTNPPHPSKGLAVYISNSPEPFSSILERGEIKFLHFTQMIVCTPVLVLNAIRELIETLGQMMSFDFLFFRS